MILAGCKELEAGDQKPPDINVHLSNGILKNLTVTRRI